MNGEIRPIVVKKGGKLVARSLLRLMWDDKNQTPVIEFMNDCLLIDKNILVLADLHIGYEDILAGKGIFPRRQLKDIIEKLNGIFWDLNMKGI